MTAQPISLQAVLRFSLGCTYVSSFAALAFLAARRLDAVRGPVFGLGVIAALLGSGVALWYSIRAGDRRLVAALVLSLLPLVFWSWFTFRIVFCPPA